MPAKGSRILKAFPLIETVFHDGEMWQAELKDGYYFRGTDTITLRGETLTELYTSITTSGPIVHHTQRR